MPKGKQSISALGKSWSMVDIDNLQKAADMLTQLNNLLDNFADSSSKEVENWIDKKQKIINSLEGMSIKIKTEGARIDENSLKAMQKEANEALVLLNILKQQNQQLEKGQKTTQKTVRQRQQERAEEARRLKQEQLNKQGPKFKNYGILNWGSYVRDKSIFNSQEKVLNNETKAILKRLQDKGHNIEESKVREIAERRLEEDRLKSPEAKKANKNRDDANKKLSLAGDVLNEAGKLLSSVAKKFMDLFFSGAQKQVDAYNNTYDSVAARLNINRDTYRSQWTNANRNIKSAGLIDNVGTSTVMEQWDVLAKTGMSEGQVFESALDTVVTQKIVPYLDTTSTEFSLINNRLDNRFVKDIRGINVLNKEIAGNNYATQDMLNTIINEVQPISDKALEDLAQGSAEVTAYVNSLIKQGVSKDVAESYGKELFQMMNYSDSMIQNGTVAQKMHVINNIAQGIDYEDPTKWNDAMGVMVDADMMLMGNAPGYGNARQGLTTNIVGSALGINPGNRRAMYQLKEKGITGSSLVDQTNLTKEQVVAASEQETQNLVDGIYNTEKEMQELTMENISTEMAKLQAKMGVVGDLIVDAIKSIGTILITKIFTDGIGNIAGMIGGSGGKGLAASGGLIKTIGSGLAATGPIGLAVAGVGVGVAALAAVASGIAAESRKKDEDSKDKDAKQKAINYAVASGTISNTKGAKEAYGARERQEAGAHNNNMLSFNAVGVSDVGAEIGGMFHSIGNNGDYGTEYYKNQLLRMFNWSDDNTAKKYGITKHWYLSGSKEAGNALEDFKRNHKDREYNKLLLAMLASLLHEKSYSGINVASVAAALQIAAMYQGLAGESDIMGPISEELNFEDLSNNKSALGDALHTAGITRAEQLRDIFKFLHKYDVHLMTGDGYNYLGFPDRDDQQEALKKDFNLLRRGLNRVPYDNYPALLHEDEAVLTASTANELRTLVSEYRDTKHQSYNFETIIQDQTTTLCNKIDELIRVVQGDSYPSLTDTDINTRNSMKKMKSIFSLIKD